MIRFGLIGYPLSHSFSERWFNDKFTLSGVDALYSNYPLRQPGGVRKLVIKEGLSGFNVTVPHKEAVIPFLDKLDKEAEDIGAVNLVTIKGEGKEIIMKGFNTDHRGFAASLVKKGIQMPGSALLLGTGGAAKAVRYALEVGDCTVQEVSRTPSVSQIGWNMLDNIDIAGFDLVVNCTPVGMYPDTDAELAFPYWKLVPGQILYDLIYNPGETGFLRRGREAGCTTVNGMDMLVGQAEEGWRIWSALIPR